MEDQNMEQRVVKRFINKLMWDGKRTKMELMMSKVFERLTMEQFLRAIRLASPVIEMRSKRIGGRNYQVPVEIPYKRQEGKGMKWIIEETRKNKKGKPMSDQLVTELKLTLDKKGGAYRKKMELHKLGEANKSYLHYRW